LSVRTDGEIKKEMLPLLMNSLRKVEITELLDIGAVILTDVLGSGVNVIATASLRQQMAYVKR